MTQPVGQQLQSQARPRLTWTGTVGEFRENTPSPAQLLPGQQLQAQSRPRLTWVATGGTTRPDPPPPGRSLLDTPPPAPQRRTDYSVWSGSALLLPPPATPTGSPVGNTLHAQARPRQTWVSGSPSAPVGGGPAPVGAQVFPLNPPPAPARLADYTWIATPLSSPQAARPMGNQMQAQARPRLTWVATSNSLLTSPPTAADAPAGASNTQRNPTGYARLADYTHLLFNINLTPPPAPIVPPPPGAQSFVAPPASPQRLPEYTFLHNNNPYLGQDTIFGAPGEAPAYDWPNPRAAARLADYTVLVSGTRYIGQDTIYGAPGQAPSYDWQNALPTRGYGRLADYTVLVGRARYYPAPSVSPLPPSLPLLRVGI